MKCGSGEGWKRSTGQTGRQMRKYYIQPKRRGDIKHNNGIIKVYRLVMCDRMTECCMTC